MSDNRANPDELLRKLQQAEAEVNLASRNQGKLKIFLGFCAGVGKTYRMLSEANAMRENGTDVLAGLVETHGRKETEELLTRLSIVPRKNVVYQNLHLEEMDLDAILSRKPQIALVDELAHSNVPGSRHKKRYQDIEELLSAGIDVYTTVNIQHIESLIDIIHQISHVKVDETVPDRLLQMADEIELVDLPPEKLIERLKEGKVYVPDKAKQAMQRFFRMGNLLALRELSLKYTAKRVDVDLLSYKENNLIQEVWPVGTRLLVGISPSPKSEKVIRMAHRMAEDLNAEWYAISVDSPQQVKMNERAKLQLEKNITLAEELGARTVFLSGNNIADEMLRFAREKNINLIIAGLSYRSRIEEVFKGSVLRDLVRKSGSINVLIVGADENTSSAPLYNARGKKSFKNYRSYLLSFLGIVVTVLIGWFLRRWVEPINIAMMLLVPAIASGILWGMWVGLFASLVAVCAFDFFFVPPFMTFRVADLKYIPSFFMFIAITIIISVLAKIIHWQIESSRSRERFTSALYSFSKEMMLAEDLENILDRAANYIAEAFQCSVAILLPEDQGELEVKTQVIHHQPSFGEDEIAVAEWVFKNGQSAGKNTQTLSSDRWYYRPITANNQTIGVLCLLKDELLNSEQDHLLESFANIVALSIIKSRKSPEYVKLFYDLIKGDIDAT
ncbi:MAG: DUF4118 domain-containing protein [Candidatus Zhuqueibacterota bacterium]